MQCIITSTPDDLRIMTMVASGHKTPDDFPKEVRDREKRRLRSLKKGKNVWFGLGFFGLVGWSVAVPAVAGIFIGLWLEKRGAGGYAWSLMLFFIGLGFGCYNVWYWVQKERDSITKQGDQNDA